MIADRKVLIVFLKKTVLDISPFACCLSIKKCFSRTQVTTPTRLAYFVRYLCMEVLLE